MGERGAGGIVVSLLIAVVVVAALQFLGLDALGWFSTAVDWTVQQGHYLAGKGHQ